MTISLLENNRSYVNSYRKVFHDRFNRISVLFIDDDYVNYLYFKELLNESVKNIYRAVSLSQAIEKLSSGNNFQIIFLSASLPENFNNFALQYIKKRFPKLPVITLLDSQCRNLESDMLKAGSEMCISRYTDQEHIIDAFYEVLESTEYAR